MRCRAEASSMPRFFIRRVSWATWFAWVTQIESQWFIKFDSNNLIASITMTFCFDRRTRISMACSTSGWTICSRLWSAFSSEKTTRARRARSIWPSGPNTQVPKADNIGA